tara:strand:- start:891 stop:1424 length:534 start_codon:yes stop_codon:yes gene_type:complete
MNKIILIFTFLIFLPNELQAINLNKIKAKAKKELKKAEKQVTEKVKPLTIEMKVSDISYNPIKSLNTLKLTIDFNGNNPNDLGVTFNKTEFDLFANDALLTKFYNDKKISIPKNDIFLFQETAEIKLLEAGKTLFNSIVKNNVVYTVIGKYFIQTPLGEFSFDVKLLEKEINPEQAK